MRFTGNRNVGSNPTLSARSDPMPFDVGGDPGVATLGDGAGSDDTRCWPIASEHWPRVKIGVRRNFREISPKGYVPLLILDDGQPVGESIAVLSLIAERAPHFLPDGELGRTRMLEALSFISALAEWQSLMA
jgi:hypothetical protein